MRTQRFFSAATLTTIAMICVPINPQALAVTEAKFVAEGVSSEATAAAESAGLPAGSASGSGVEIPTGMDSSPTFTTSEGTLEMDVRSTNDGVQTPHGVVFDVPGRDASVTVQSTEAGGLRALISIDSKAAPTEFTFPLAGDVARVELHDLGGAIAFGADNETIAYAPAPWAVDADGTSVPTHFEVRGTALVQVVSHRDGNYEYGIVADPWWNPFSWNWSKIGSTVAKGAKQAGKVAVCVSAITLVVLPVAKGAKLGQGAWWCYSNCPTVGRRGQYDRGAGDPGRSCGRSPRGDNSEVQMLLGGDTMFGSGSNLQGIDEGRKLLAEGALADDVRDPSREVDAVKGLRELVPSLSLVDAVRLIREARDGSPE